MITFSLQVSTVVVQFVEDCGSVWTVAGLVSVHEVDAPPGQLQTRA